MNKFDQLYEAILNENKAMKKAQKFLDQNSDLVVDNWDKNERVIWMLDNEADLAKMVKSLLKTGLKLHAEDDKTTFLIDEDNDYSFFEVREITSKTHSDAFRALDNKSTRVLADVPRKVVMLQSWKYAG